MKNLKTIILGFGLFISLASQAQCYDDACDDDNDMVFVGETACCVATTAGMTWSGYGDVDCVQISVSRRSTF